MGQAPQELTSQIELFEGVIESLNGVIDVNKVPVQYYGADFIPPLNDIRQKALELRNSIEVFKSSLEASISTQYASKNNRFSSTKRVIKSYISGGAE